MPISFILNLAGTCSNINKQNPAIAGVFKSTLGFASAVKGLSYFQDDLSCPGAITGTVLFGGGVLLSTKALTDLFEINCVSGIGLTLALASISSFYFLKNDRSSFCVPFAIGTLSLGSIVWRSWMERRKFTAPPDSKFRNEGVVTKILFYPIKSGKGIVLDECQCDINGLTYRGIRDRSFAVVHNEEKSVITGRIYPELTQIAMGIEGTKLTLTAPGMETLAFNLESIAESLKPLEFIIWGDAVKGRVCDQASDWLDKYFGKKGFHLVYATDVWSQRVFEHRKLFALYRETDKAIYSDLCPYHLINEASVDNLNSRLESKVTAERYRPNIIVDGASGFAEDDWKFIKIGDEVLFRNIKPCTRCVFTTVNPETGIKDNEESLKTLRKYRQVKDKVIAKLEKFSPAFGINLGLDKCGRIKVGDVIRVTN